MLGLSEEEAISPEYDCISVALGTAIYAEGEAKYYTFDELEKLFESAIDDRRSFRLSAFHFPVFLLTVSCFQESAGCKW